MRTFFAAALILFAAASASAKDYSADRFDSRIEVLAGGSLRVTETIVFRFEGGTFTRVFRTIPTRSTDGVEFVSASMDGVNFPRGEGAGQVSLKRQNGVRVEWTFAPTGPSTHTFVLQYVAKGVARRAADADVVGWRALPTEHAYRIASSTIEMLLPAQPLGPPTIEVRRVAQHDLGDDLERTGTRIVVRAQTIGKNGWIEVWSRLPRDAVIATPPAWQQRREDHRAFRNPSVIAAGVIVLIGLVIMFGLRQSYDSPPRDVQAPQTFSGPPDTLAPGLAGALVTNGRPQLEHAMAALFSLASRGVVTIREEPKGTFGQRRFTIGRATTRPLQPHEEAVLDAIFSTASSADGRVDLNKARTQAVRRFSKFKDAVLSELGDAGLLDAGRRQVQLRYFILGGLFLAAMVVAAIPIAFAVNAYGPWLILIPAALVVLGAASFIAASALTPLSNEGVRRASQWRAYQKQLRDLPKDGVTRNAWSTGHHSPSELLPIAVALGLATVWSKLYKMRGVPLPPWFQAASSSDAHPAFIAFVGTGGAGHGGGGAGGAGGGGAAGGGASGAS